MVSPVTIFIHIPKTGGVTFQTIFRRQFPKDKILDVGVVKNKTSYEDFLGITNTNSERTKYQAVMGHIPYRFHACGDADGRYITMLRDPVKRFISQYSHVLRAKHVAVNHLIGKKSIHISELNNLDDITIEDFLKLEIAEEFCNLQTRYLCAPGNGGTITEKDLKTAKNNLQDKFTCFGLTDRFDESLILFKKNLGWGKIYYKKKNVSKKRISEIALSEETLKQIKTRNQYDVDLFNFGKTLFEKRINEIEGFLISEKRKLKFKNLFAPLLIN